MSLQAFREKQQKVKPVVERPRFGNLYQENSISRGILLLVGLSLLVSLEGCNKKNRVKVYPVSGSILFDKQPAPGAQIVLHPTSSEPLPADLVLGATADKEGKFKLNGYKLGDGVPAGEYVATVLWFKSIEEPSGSKAGPNVMPEQYSKKETSPLKIKVEEKANELPPIDIQLP